MCEIEILTCAKMAQFTTELVHEMKFILIIIFVFGINFLNQFTYGRLIKQDGGKFIPSQRIPLVPKFIPRNFPNAIRLTEQREETKNEDKNNISSSNQSGIFFLSNSFS